MEEENQLVAQRKLKLKKLLDRGINPYPSIFHKKNFASEILEKYKKVKTEEKTSEKVSIAGRIMTHRILGKAGFAHIQDSTGQIQIYARQDDLGQGEYELFSGSDLGDIVGI